VLAVAAGGLVGSAVRGGIGMVVLPSWGGFPTTTAAINLTGSFLLGFYLARRERSVTRPKSLHFWAIGMLGAFTTFSTFSVELLRLIVDGEGLLATGYLTVSVIGGLIAAITGQRSGAAVA
jgi:CrcB protein